MKLYIFIFILLFSFKLEAKIVISEVLASNFRGLLDEDNDDSDWIELYNDSDEDINIGGYRIYDKDNYEEAFILPDTVIKARERIIIFASGKNRYTSNKYWVETTGIGMASHLGSESVKFDCSSIEGDFDIEVKIDKILSNKRYTCAGLMFRESLETKSKFYSFVTMPSKYNLNTIYLKNDIENLPENRMISNLHFDINILRMLKSNNRLHFLMLSKDGFNYDTVHIEETKFNKGYLGIVFAASDMFNIEKDTFLVSDLKINGLRYNIEELSKYDINKFGVKSLSKKYKEIHTNFKLNKGNEKIYLWNNKKDLIFNILYKNDMTNISSIFEIENDSSTIQYYGIPSPNSKVKTKFKYILDTPIFNKQSLSGKSESNIQILHKDIDNVYFTFDGSEPTKESNLSLDEIKLKNNSIIRAKTIKEAGYQYEEGVYSLINDIESNIPIISIIINEEDLYSDENGIFSEKNLGRKIENIGYIDYIRGDYNFKSKVGLRIHGGGTRYFFPQKSFRVYDRYSKDSEFEFDLWGENNKEKFTKFVIKNGGQDWLKLFVRDAFVNCLISKNLYNLDFKKTQISLSYINGKFYGISNIKERTDEDYFKLKYNLSSTESINIKMNNELVNGKFDKFFNILDSLENVNDSLKLEIVNENFDLKNILEYTFIRLFTASDEWPYWNELIWNSEEFDNKWRWVPNDFDVSLGASYNSFVYQNTLKRIYETHSEYTYIFKILLKDSKFIVNLSNIIADNLNSNFKYENTILHIDSLTQITRPYIKRQQELYNESLMEYEIQLEHIKTFLKERPNFLFQHTAEEFGQSGITSLTFTQNYENAGVFHINSLNITEKEWNGRYFNEIPIKVSVSSNPGYRFIGWQNFETGDSVLTDILPKEYEKFEAIFEKTDIAPETYKKKIVINEIMYKPYEFMDCGDWIELYNSGNRDIDLSNWSFRDDNFQHVYNVLEGVTLKAGEFLIIAQDPMKFRSYYGVAKNVIGGFEFGLGGDDEIRIYNESNQIVDEVRYRNNLPWDEFADGTGYSLELIHPDLDNSLPESWRASYNYGGSSLAHNTVLELENNQIEVDISVFPNPFNEFVSIQNNGNKVNLEIYNVLGEKLIKIENIQSYYKLDLSTYNSGVYYFVFKDFKGELVRTLNIIKN